MIEPHLNSFFFFNDTATTEIYTLSLHDALPICLLDRVKMVDVTNCTFDGLTYNVQRYMQEILAIKPDMIFLWRSEEHTSELQSRQYLVCRLLLEKKTKTTNSDNQ